MKILLINPPITLYAGGTNPRVYMPLGLLSIAAQLEKDGHDVKINDALLEARIDDTESLGEKQFGQSWETISKNIADYHPDIVGITSMFASQSQNAKKIAKIAKNISSDITTIIGGTHASADPDTAFDDTNVDLIIIGEGELTMSKIIKCLNTKDDFKSINGIYSRYNNILIKNPTPERINNLDNLPLPAYHLYDIEKYFILQNSGYCARPIGYGTREISITTSRGCPYDCVFCSIHPTMGKKWRAYSAEYVINHIRHVVDKYKVDLIHFEDDNFSLDRKRFMEILDALIDLKLKVKWDPPNGLRADSLDEEMIKKAIKSGCQYVVIAIESGVQRVLEEVINKRLDLKQVASIAQICKKLNIELYAYYVVGLPGETIDEIRQTLAYAAKMLLRYFIYPQIATASPVFGSRLYDICKENSYCTKDITPRSLAIAYDSTGLGLIETREFSPVSIKRLIAKYNKYFAIIMLINIFRRPQRLLRYYRILKRNPYLFKKLLLNKS